LRIIGEGPERRRLEERAGPNVRFLGSQPDSAVVQAMQGCRAFVFAGEEDFGIVMAEAQSCGKPVIALGRGGAVEIVEQDITGILFEEQSADSLIDALEQFDAQEFDPLLVRRSALRFSRERFLLEFAEFVACNTM
jgi:glycosyltransferase involved in cell wall biosynthesis